MNISKILLGSVIFPIVYPKRFLNVVTIPIFMLVCNWGFAVNLGGENVFFSWFSYAFQYYAISIYITNCVLLVTKNENPQFIEIQSLYAKCSILLIAYTFAVWGVKYCFVMFWLNIFGVSGPDNFSQLDALSNIVSQMLLFSLFFVIPHYIYTGKLNVKVVLRNNRKHFFALTFIIFIIEVSKGVIGYVFTGVTTTPTLLLGTVILFIFQGVGYIAISLCYTSIFPNQDISNNT